jgi:hypothetical protein
MPMTNGACGEIKEEGAHETNWVKLKRKTAFTRYSVATGFCADAKNILHANRGTMKL